MRRLLPSICFLFLGLLAVGQPGDVFKIKEIFPEKPTEGDSLFFVYYASVPNNVWLWDARVKEDVHGITVLEFCVYESPLTGGSEIYDTLYLGRAKAGLFRLFMAAFYSQKADTCMPGYKSSTYYFERRVYPVNFTILGNPVSDQLLELIATKPIRRMVFYNEFGEPVLSEGFDLETDIQINLSHLPDGVYHIMGYFEEGQVVVKKMVKRTL